MVSLWLEVLEGHLQRVGQKGEYPDNIPSYGWLVKVGYYYNEKMGQ